MLHRLKKITAFCMAVLIMLSGMPVTGFAQEKGTDTVTNFSSAFSLRAQGLEIVRLELDPRSSVVFIGNTQQFHASVPARGLDDVSNECLWTSKDTSIATVDQTGNVTGVAEGIVEIECVYGTGKDQLKAYAVVTVTPVEYKIIYESNYPKNAKKYIYENGKNEGAKIGEAVNTSVTYAYIPHAEVIILGDVFSLIDYEFIGYRDENNNFYLPQQKIELTQTNLHLIAQWEKRQQVRQEWICVQYNLPGKKTVNKWLEASVVQNDDGTADVTFITGNVQDTIEDGNYDDVINGISAWEINGQEYGLNTQVTVTATKNDGKWFVKANAVAADHPTDVYAQFYVRRRDATTGTGTDQYHSVGSGMIDVSSFEPLEYDHSGGPNYDKIKPGYVCAGRDDMSQDVGAYILSAPSIEHIASLMNTKLDDHTTVKWYVIKQTLNGWHVDGIMYTETEYHKVEFVDPADANTVYKTVLVEDFDWLHPGDVPTTTHSDNPRREFKGWSLSENGPVIENIPATLKNITKDIVLYAQYTVYDGYTVKYLEDETDIELADEVNVRAAVKTIIGKEDIEEKSIPGYQYKRRSCDSLTVLEGQPNEIILYYTKRNDLSYTVNYLEQGTNEVLNQAKEVKNKTYLEQVTEKAIDIAGYNKVDPTTQTLTIQTENNVINFYYTKRTDIPYTVEFYYENVNGNGYTMDNSKTKNLTGTYLATVSITEDDRKETKNGAFTYDEQNVNKVESVVLNDAKGATNVLRLYFNRNLYKVEYTYTGTVPNGAAPTPSPAEYKYGTTVQVASTPAPVDGYDFYGWHPTSEVSIWNNEFTMPANDVVLQGSWAPSTSTAYKVEHYLEKGENDYQKKETEDKKGTTDQTADYSPKSYTGFTFDATKTTFWSGNTQLTEAGKDTIRGDGSLVIKLYYTRNKVDIDVTKTWDDDNDRDGVRPAKNAFTVTLTEKGGDGRTYSTSIWSGEGDVWTGTISGVPTHKLDGTQITTIEYEVTETDCSSNYTKTGTTSIIPANEVNSSVSLINTHETAKTSISGQKTWIDGNGTSKTRPQSIIIKLMNGNTEVARQIVMPDENGVWSWNFENVHTNENGHPIAYSIQEEAVDGYEASYDSYNVTNTIDDIEETINVSGTKTWVDGQKAHNNEQDVVLTLTQKSAKANAVATTITNVTPTWNGNEYTYSNLPKYDSEGYLYTYTVTEAKVDGYADPEYSGTNGYDITNTKLQDITVTKAWVEPQESGMDHPQVTFTLYKATDTAFITPVATAVREGDTNQYKFENIPYEPSGYVVVESMTGTNADYYSTVNNGTTSISANTTSITVTNTRKTEGSLTIAKTAVDTSSDSASTADLYFGFQVTCNGQPVGNVVYVRGGQSETVSNLPLGETYTVNETGVYTKNDGLYTKIDNGLNAWKTSYDANSATLDLTHQSATLTFTNTRKLYNENGELTVQKLWKNGDATNNTLADSLIPANVQVTLSGSTSSGQAANLGDTTRTLNQGNNWQTTYNNLPATDLLGNPYTYTAEEVGENKGKVTYTANDGKAYTYDVTYNGKTITNTLANNTSTPTTKDADQEVVEIDDTIVYTITRTSHLNQTTSATITDTLPEGLTYVSSKVNGVDTAPNQAGQQLTWTVTNVQPMAAVTVEVTVKVNRDAVKYDRLTNTATIAFAGEVNLEPGSSEVEVKKPDLSILKVSDKTNASVKPGEALNYTITVSNHGNGKATEVEVADALPNTVYMTQEQRNALPTNVTYAEGKLTWRIAEISAGEQTTLNFSVMVKAENAEAGSDKLSEGAIAVINTAIITEQPPVTTDQPSSEDNTPIARFTMAKAAALPEGRQTAVLNDSIAYTVTVVNNGGVALNGVKVADAMFAEADPNSLKVTVNNTDAAYTLSGSELLLTDDLKVGAAATITYTYTVREKDLFAGYVHNVATVTTQTPTDEKRGETTTPTETPSPALAVEKEGVPPQGFDGTYGLGETITYAIKVKNVGNVTLKDIVVTDSLGAGDGIIARIASLAPNAEENVTFTYVVTKEDILAGFVKNVATAAGSDPDGNPVTATDDTEDPTDPMQGRLEKNKITLGVKDGEAYSQKAKYELGDTIWYSITVKNTGNVDYTDVIIKDELTGLNKNVGTLAIGQSVTEYTSYTVTEKDILQGGVANYATVGGTTPTPKPTNPTEVPKPTPIATPTPNPDPTPDTKDDMEEVKTKLTVEKKTTSTPKDGKAYILGEEISYAISVKNESNVTLTNVIVTDEMTGDEWTLASLAPGASETFTTTYQVTEADVLAGKVVNVATAKGKSPAPDNPDVFADPSKTEDQTGSTTEVPTEGPTEAPIEVPTESPTEAPIEVPTESPTEAPIEVPTESPTEAPIEVPTESPTGGPTEAPTESPTEAPTEGPTEGPTEAPTESPTEAPTEGPTESPTGGPTEAPTENPTEVPTEDPTEEQKGHLTITKTTTSQPANGAAYALGETIVYEIEAKNDGNLTLTNVVVTDELTGDEWTIETLAPGASEKFTTTYQVTEADILAGSVVNVATAKGESPDPEEPDVPVEPGKTEDPTEEQKGHLTITKTTTSQPANGTAYVLGETIVYEIEAKNDGNLTLTNVVVTDELTGDEWTIETLAPGASERFTTTYQVMEADVLAGSVVNVATAKGESPDPEEPDVPVEPGSTEEIVEEKNPHLTVTKRVTSTPANAEGYSLGETIQYEITVTNDGNLTAENIEVTDILSDNEGHVIATIPSLQPGESGTVQFAYVVTGADLTAGMVRNQASVVGRNPDPDGELEIPVVPGETETPVRNVLTLTINYWYDRVGGEVAAPTFRGVYTYGQTYSVASPRISGYTADIINATGRVLANTTIDVIYTRNTYTVTVQYRYLDGQGGEAAPDHVQTGMLNGDEYSIESPAIPGWRANKLIVEGKVPGSNVVITVFYLRNGGGSFVEIDEYGVPLGVGNVVVNVGDCFE